MIADVTPRSSAQDDLVQFGQLGLPGLHPASQIQPEVGELHDQAGPLAWRPIGWPFWTLLAGWIRVHKQILHRNQGSARRPGVAHCPRRIASASCRLGGRSSRSPSSKSILLGRVAVVNRLKKSTDGSADGRFAGGKPDSNGGAEAGGRQVHRNSSPGII